MKRSIGSGGPEFSAELCQKLRGKYIVLDGIDGAGKGAQLNLLEKRLIEAGVEVVRARDPGGTPIGDRIRHVLLDYDLSEMDVRCEALLFMASRAQLARDVIRPALAQRKVCLGDRFVSATCAYQGAAGFDPREVVALAKHAIVDTWPDVTLVLDVPLKAGLERTRRSGTTAPKKNGGARHPTLFHDVHVDAMESRPADYHERVRQLFLELPAFYPSPVRIVDGLGSVDEVHARIAQALSDAV